MSSRIYKCPQQYPVSFMSLLCFTKYSAANPFNRPNKYGRDSIPFYPIYIQQCRSKPTPQGQIHSYTPSVKGTQCNASLWHPQIGVEYINSRPENSGAQYLIIMKTLIYKCRVTTSSRPCPPPNLHFQHWLIVFVVNI